MVFGQDERDALEKLVEKAQLGDSRAFGEIYDMLVNEIYRFLFFRVRDEQTAQDLTADTFRKMLVHLNGYKRNNFRAYVYTVARNTLTDHFRSQKHIALHIDMESIVDEKGINSNDVIFDMRVVTQAFKKLSHEYSEIISLRFIEGYSIEETAAILEKSEGAIRVLQHRAIQKLKEIVHYG